MLRIPSDTIFFRADISIYKIKTLEDKHNHLEKYINHGF
jgi:hypothetical protein